MIDRAKEGAVSAAVQKPDIGASANTSGGRANEAALLDLITV